MRKRWGASELQKQPSTSRWPGRAILFGLAALLLLVTGCSDIIAIELIPTRTPTPTPTITPTPTSEPVVIDLATVGAPIRIAAEKIGLDASVVRDGLGDRRTAGAGRQ